MTFDSNDLRKGIESSSEVDDLTTYRVVRKTLVEHAANLQSDCENRPYARQLGKTFAGFSISATVSQLI